MNRCPECGASIEAPLKTWSISRRTSKSGESKKTILGIFECSGCGHRFRAGVKDKEELSIKGASEKIKGIEAELMNTLKNLREKIKTLETERANLLVEIDELKKMAEAKASALESEVDMLSEEVKSLRQLLGVGEIEL